MEEQLGTGTGIVVGLLILAATTVTDQLGAAGGRTEAADSNAAFAAVRNS